MHVRNLQSLTSHSTQSEVTWSQNTEWGVSSVYDGKDMWNGQVFSLDWKTDEVTDSESCSNKDYDDLTCVKCDKNQDD